MTPEGRTKKRIKAMLAECDAFYFMPVQMGFGAPSLDFLGCRPRDGRMFGIEAKKWGGKPTTRQKATLARMSEKGVRCFVCDDEWDDKTPVFDSLALIKKWLTSDS